jgi:cation transport ATPase
LPTRFPPDASIDPLLDRPAADRLREFRYRFAQSAVFGLPVILLQWLGPSLGGRESARWVALFQAILASWVIYVGAAGMLFEGLLLLTRGRFSPDLVPALLAICLYLLGLYRALPLILHPSSPRFAPTFHLAVAVLLLWSAIRWGWIRFRMR